MIWSEAMIVAKASADSPHSSPSSTTLARLPTMQFHASLSSSSKNRSLAANQNPMALEASS